MAWVIVAGAGWAAVAVLVGLVLGRVIRVADGHESRGRPGSEPATGSAVRIPAPRTAQDPSLTR